MKRIEVGCLLFSILYFLSAPALGAAISGRVEVAGPYNIKPRKTLEERIKAERSLVVSEDGSIKNAVIFIKGKRENSSLPGEMVIDQKNKAFVPHVLPIFKGTKVTFNNSDPFVHRIISNSEAKKLRMEFAYEGARVDITFDAPGIVEIWCDDHRRMQGWILVLETPFFAVADERGSFTIPEVPPGEYRVEVWHEILGAQAQEIIIEEGGNAKVNFALPGKEF